MHSLISNNSLYSKQKPGTLTVRPDQRSPVVVLAVDDVLFVVIEIDADERTGLAAIERLVARNAQLTRQAFAKILKARSGDLDDVLVLDRPEVDHVGGVHAQRGPLHELAVVRVHFEFGEKPTLTNFSEPFRLSKPEWPTL